MVRRSIVALLLAAAMAAFLAFRWNRLPAAPAQKNAPTGGQAADMAPAHAVSSPGPSPAPAKGGFAEVAAAELSELRAGKTLREFVASHPNEHPSSPGQGDADLGFRGSCASAVVNIPLNSGTALERVAAFYPPPSPSPVVAPAARSAGEMVDDCILGAVYIRSPLPDPNQAATVATAVVKSVSTSFGDPQPVPLDRYFNPSWRNRTQWKREDISVNTGYDTYKIRPTDVPSFAAYGYHEGLFEDEQKISQWWQQQIVLPPQANVNFEFAVDMAGLGAGAAAAMRGGYSRALATSRASGTNYSAAVKRAVLLADEEVTVLRQWLRGVNDLPKPSRAAAFLAAYYLVRASESVNWRNPRIMSTFEKEGSKYWKRTAIQDDDSLGRWLGLAFSLDPAGPIGERIVLEQMAQECYFDGFYDGTGPLFEHVIADGESYLTRKHEPAEVAQAEFSLAKAYQDLVEVASGRLGDVDRTPYRPRLAEARAKALQHYSAVINFDPNAIKAKISWRESWNLLADLPSRRYHYTCPTGD